MFKQKLMAFINTLNYVLLSVINRVLQSKYKIYSYNTLAYNNNIQNFYNNIYKKYSQFQRNIIKNSFLCISYCCAKLKKMRKIIAETKCN